MWSCGWRMAPRWGTGGRGNAATENGERGTAERGNGDRRKSAGRGWRAGGKWSSAGGEWSSAGGEWASAGGEWASAGGDWSSAGGEWSSAGGEWWRTPGESLPGCVRGSEVQRAPGPANRGKERDDPRRDKPGCVSTGIIHTSCRGPPDDNRHPRYRGREKLGPGCDGAAAGTPDAGAGYGCRGHCAAHRRMRRRAGPCLRAGRLLTILGQRSPNNPAVAGQVGRAFRCLGAVAGRVN